MKKYKIALIIVVSAIWAVATLLHLFIGGISADISNEWGRWTAVFLAYTVPAAGVIWLLVRKRK